MTFSTSLIGAAFGLACGLMWAVALGGGLVAGMVYGTVIGLALAALLLLLHRRAAIAGNVHDEEAKLMIVSTLAIIFLLADGAAVFTGLARWLFF